MNKLKDNSNYENDYGILDLKDFLAPNFSVAEYFADIKISRALIRCTPNEFQLHSPVIKNFSDQLQVSKLLFHKNKPAKSVGISDVLSKEFLICDTSQEYLKDLVSYTYLREKNERLKFVSSLEIEQTIQSITQKIDRCDTLVINQDNITTAFCILSKMKIFNCMSDLVSWIWISPSLKTESRKSIHSSLEAWINQRSSSENIYAAIHQENTRSIQLFRKFEFNTVGFFVKYEK